MKRVISLFVILLFIASAVPVKAETYMLSFDGDDYVEYGKSYVVDDFEVDSGWIVQTKTGDGTSSVARDSTIKISGEYSAKFDAYLDGIAANGYDWNDLRQANFYDWSDCVGVGFWVYVPAEALGKNVRLSVGFYDGKVVGWMRGIDLNTLTHEGWYYVAVYKGMGNRKIDWNNAKLIISIFSSDASLDETTITVYIDRVEKIRYDLRNYTAVVGVMTNIKGTGNRQGILQIENGGYSIRLFVNPDYIEFDRVDRVRLNEYDNLIGGFEVGRYYVVAGSYDGSQGKLYMNGQLVSSTTEDMSFLGNLDVLRVSWRADKYLDGKVLFVMLYNRALSDEEIQQIYENPNNPPRTGLILWYAPDSVDVVSGVWKDKSGLGNDGKIMGATAERVSILKFNVYDFYGNKISDIRITDLKYNETSSMPVFPSRYGLDYRLFNVSSPLGLYSVIGTTPNANKEIYVTLGGGFFVGNRTLKDEFVEGFKESLGSSLSAGLVALLVGVGLLLGMGAHIAPALAIVIPVVAGLSKYGYLPSWFYWSAVIAIGVLTVNIVLEALGGRD